MKRTLLVSAAAALLVFAAADCNESSCAGLKRYCTQCACAASRAACANDANFGDEATCQATLDDGSQCRLDSSCGADPSSSSNTSSGSGDTTGSGMPAVGLSLEVTHAVVTSVIYDANQYPNKAGNGNQFLVVDVTLSNKDIPKVLSQQDLFTLKTNASLLYPPSYHSGELPKPCPNVGIAPGGSVACQLAFEIPLASQGTSLSYDDLMGATATAKVPAATVPVCQQAEDKLNALIAQQAPASCINAALTKCSNQYMAATTGGCASNKACLAGCFQGFSKGYCGCEAKCYKPGSDCAASFDSYLSCVAAALPASCG